MNLQEIMNNITTIGGQIAAASARLSADASNPSVPMDEIRRQQEAISDLQARKDALQQVYNDMQDSMKAGLTGIAPKAGEPRSRKDMRASNEYVRAFCYALSRGINPRNGMGNEKVKILYDALSEGGGDPVGTDGGFLVPIDIDNSIRELRRELNPLAPLFSEETVTAPTGWRVMDTAPSAGMTKVDELDTVPKDDQPAFSKVTFSLDKYGLRLPISNELMKDEAANLMAYISRWFAKKLVLTENGLLLTALKTLAASALTSGTITPDGAIKTILNKTLDPAISNRAVIITNQSGFDALDQLTDDMGRGLLQPDPTNSTLLRIYGRRIVKVANSQLPDVSGSPNKAEFFIGDPAEFATLFRKEGFEVASTDIGGDAWAKDLTEVRGIVRMCVTKFDTSAMVRRQLSLG